MPKNKKPRIARGSESALLKLLLPQTTLPRRVIPEDAEVIDRCEGKSHDPSNLGGREAKVKRKFLCEDGGTLVLCKQIDA